MGRSPAGEALRRVKAAPRRRRIAAALLIAALAASLCAGCGRTEERRERAAALKMADFILGLQLENGAIPDAADADTVNEDSDMEYALIALAAAYRSTGRESYLSGLERGIAWLAGAEVMEDGPWKGSWWYRYDRNGRPLPASESGGDVRGVDASGALFVYLLYLDRLCAGSDAVVAPYRENAAAALEFVLTRSRSVAGFFASAFSEDGTGGWSRSDCCYAADQGDVWLGLRAGALLYGGDEYGEAADFLRENVPDAFFSGEYGRYCAGIASGRQDWSEEGFAPVQSQGYLPWLWGDTAENRQAVSWLRERLSGDLSGEYFLSAAFLGLGEQGIGGETPRRSFAWLLERGLDEADGGVRDSLRDPAETVNTAAFCALALMRWSPDV